MKIRIRQVSVKVKTVFGVLIMAIALLTAGCNIHMVYYKLQFPENVSGKTELIYEFPLYPWQNEISVSMDSDVRAPGIPSLDPPITGRLEAPVPVYLNGDCIGEFFQEEKDIRRGGLSELRSKKSTSVFEFGQQQISLVLDEAQLKFLKENSGAFYCSKNGGSGDLSFVFIPIHFRETLFPTKAEK